MSRLPQSVSPSAKYRAIHVVALKHLAGLEPDLSDTRLAVVSGALEQDAIAKDQTLREGSWIVRDTSSRRCSRTPACGPVRPGATQSRRPVRAGGRGRLGSSRSERAGLPQFLERHRPRVGRHILAKRRGGQIDVRFELGDGGGQVHRDLLRLGHEMHRFRKARLSDGVSICQPSRLAARTSHCDVRRRYSFAPP